MTCFLLFGCIFSVPAYSVDGLLRTISPSFSVGINYGEAHIEDVGTSQFNSVSGLSVSLGAYAEKPVSDLISVSAEFHLSNLVELGKAGASATGLLISFGGTFGRIDTLRSPYFSASLGYSYVEIGDSGEMRNPEEDDSCFVFVPCFEPAPFRIGGHAKGLGYRIAAGIAVSNSVRFELGYLNLGGEAGGKSAGAIGSMDTINIGVHFQIK